MPSSPPLAARNDSASGLSRAIEEVRDSLDYLIDALEVAGVIAPPPAEPTAAELVAIAASEAEAAKIEAEEADEEAQAAEDGDKADTNFRGVFTGARVPHDPGVPAELIDGPDLDD